MSRYHIDVLTLRVAANYSCHDAVVSVAYVADGTAYRHAGHYFALSRWRPNTRDTRPRNEQEIRVSHRKLPPTAVQRAVHDRPIARNGSLRPRNSACRSHRALVAN